MDFMNPDTITKTKILRQFQVEFTQDVRKIVKEVWNHLMLERNKHLFDNQLTSGHSKSYCHPH
jgi:hypothetical protein